MRRFASVVALIAFDATSFAQPADTPPQEPQPQPPQPPQQPPPGSTHATFMATTDMQWDVTLGGQPACATPCQLWVPSLAFVSLHSHEERPVRIEVGYLPQASNLVISAEPLHTGEYATGITFTALGGAALVTGITLGAVGYGTQDTGMKNAGMITGVSGAIVLAGAIYLVNRALPKANIQLAGSF
jgi:hypothetical protein